MERRKGNRTVYKGAKVACFSAEHQSQHDSYNFASHLVDVGLGGMCILSVGRLRDGVRMNVDIFFPQHQGGLKAIAKVKWSREIDYRGKTLFMTGLEFVGRPEFTGRALDAVRGREHRIETTVRMARFERRRHERHRVAIAEITCMPSGLLASLGLARNPARSLIDLSRSGAQVSVNKPLETGEYVRVRIRIPRVGDILTMTGRVQWCHADSRAPKKDRWVVGIAFRDVPAKSREILDGLRQWFGE
jgi:hypothetical protein